MRRVGIGVVFVVVVVVWLVGVSSSALGVVSPWWHLSSGSRPGVLHSGRGQSEVQEIVAPTMEFGGHPGMTGFSLKVPGKTPGEFVTVGEFVTEPVAAELGFVALTTANIKSALEGVYGPGAGSVSVVERVVGSSLVLTVTTLGSVVPLSVAGIGFEGEPSARVVSEGRTDGEVFVTAENLGDAIVNGGGSPTPVQLRDVLPPGLKAVSIIGSGPKPSEINFRETLPCVLETLTCTLPGKLTSYQQVEILIGVIVEPGVMMGAVNEVSVFGGEAAEASLSRPLRFGDMPTPFGVEDYGLVNEEEGGSPTTQAGAHPFQQTTTINLNVGADSAPVGVNVPYAEPVELPKDLDFKWPAGLIGNAAAIPRCSLGQFLQIINGALEDQCSPQTAVGVSAVTVFEPGGLKTLIFTTPLFNLEPAEGEPARFGFFVPLANVPVVIDTAVRTGGDYGVTVRVHNINQSAGFLASKVTVWGVPGDPRHDSSRGWGCIYASIGLEASRHSPCTPLEAHNPPPFLSLPTSCSGELHSTVEGDSWTHPGPFGTLASTALPGLDGCNQLPFSASINVAPDGQAASTPTGLGVNVHVPQDAILNAGGLAGSDVKDISVRFPEGFVINPASADGLQACSEQQVGYLPGESTPPADLHFTPTEPFCPDAAKVGTVQIKTPLLPVGQLLKGALYLAMPAPNGEEGKNPFRSLIAAYIIAKDPVSGVLVKLPGRVSLDQVTGRITATFENTPDVAFEDAEVHLFGGDRAPFATPAHCGSYTTEATITPWSGAPPIHSQSSFNITSGPNGSPCPNPLPFAPSLAAGTTNINAASFSSLTTTISREDGNQNIRTVQLHMPPGLSGILTGVKLCPEAQANMGTCGPDSLIGHTIVSVGLGGDPFSVTGGEVFLTVGYKGAPFGLSIVNPAVAGPFDLGKVIVRAKIDVDPTTAELTVTTDEIPHILDGIPLQIKHVNVTIDRSGFTFNPTNCSKLAITGSIESVEGASSPVVVPFQVTNCAILRFAPKFSVSTTGKTSRSKGANLIAKLAYPKAPQGTQTNITRVKVDLPKQLPSRLTTLQKACTNAQFEKNPAGCPTASKIGYATVTTPLLPVALNGPAIFVSHGGEAFPSLTMVLQGYGVTVDLVGATFISKKGITSTTFKTVPDVPFNTFQLTLPQGKYSALAANGNLCKANLAMPTEFRAQNGLVIHQTTKITVTHCPKHNTKHKTRHNKNTHHK
jgi:hypothetical protein